MWTNEFLARLKSQKNLTPLQIIELLITFCRKMGFNEIADEIQTKIKV